VRAPCYLDRRAHGCLFWNVQTARRRHDGLRAAADAVRAPWCLNRHTHDCLIRNARRRQHGLRAAADAVRLPVQAFACSGACMIA
jgi:hypothetical protein